MVDRTAAATGTAAAMAEIAALRQKLAAAAARIQEEMGRMLDEREGKPAESIGWTPASLRALLAPCPTAFAPLRTRKRLRSRRFPPGGAS